MKKNKARIDITILSQKLVLFGRTLNQEKKYEEAEKMLCGKRLGIERRKIEGAGWRKQEEYV